MAELLQVLGITLPIFLLIGLGYVATRQGLFDQAMLKGLSTFAIFFALPAVLFRSISSKSFADLIVPEFFLAYAGASITVFAFMYVLVRYILKEHGQRAAMWALGSSFSNTLMIGLPIYTLMFGLEAFVIPLAMIVLVETLIMLPMSLVLAESSGHGDKPLMTRIINSFKPLARNPLMIAIAVGIVASVFSIPVPAVVDNVVNLLAVTVSGVALVSIGGMLVSVPKGAIGRPLMFVLPAKLIIHPLMVTGLFFAIGGVSDMFMTIAIINGSISMFGMLPIISTRFNLGEETAGMLVVTTVMAFFSISTALWFTRTFI
jgi:predicted permease